MDKSVIRYCNNDGIIRLEMDVIEMEVSKKEIILKLLGYSGAILLMGLFFLRTGWSDNMFRNYLYDILILSAVGTMVSSNWLAWSMGRTARADINYRVTTQVNYDDYKNSANKLNIKNIYLMIPSSIFFVLSVIILFVTR